MGNPKEKAIELLDKFIQVNGNSFFAKECVLIAIKEAEKSEYNVLTKFGFVTEKYTSDYWRQVENELSIL